MMNILITAGGTKEAIDKVRHITNMSKGTLGREIAERAYFKKNVEKIYFLSPQSAFPTGYSDRMEKIKIDSIDDLYDNMKRILTNEKIDVVIHSMAVSDYKVDYVSTLESLVEAVIDFQIREDDKMTDIDEIVKYLKKGDFRIDTSSKMSSKSENPIIKLAPTQKIIGQIKKWSPNTKLVGFKLLENVTDEELIKVAREQMIKNDCDYVWTNDIKRIRNNGHQGYLVSKNKETFLNDKNLIAQSIIDAVVYDAY